MDIRNLTLEEKIGQMIIVGMDSNYITDRLKNLISNYKIGGIILYRKNFNTYKDLLKLIEDIKALNNKNKLPLFIAIDQEGGRVNRMPSEIKNLPPANVIANTKDIELVKESADITGEILKETGFNINFAPVLDIKRFDSKHAIGDRCFGENKEDVCRYGIPTMKEIQKNKIISVIKHFPGHGATKKDTHYTLPVIKDIKLLEDEDMKPFEYAISEGADAIMISHLKIKNLTGAYPASLSRKFVKYLRKKYKYNNLVITDDLKMKAVKFLYGTKISTRKAFEAGNDIIIFRYNQKEETDAINNIIDLVKAGKIKESRINRSVNRIIKMKQKYNLSDTEKVNGIDIENINKRIDKIRKKVGYN